MARLAGVKGELLELLRSLGLGRLPGRGNGRRRSPSDARRIGEELAPYAFELRTREPRAPIAVVAHVYFPELWPELQKAISQIPCPFDLLVTLVAGASDGIARELASHFPGCETYVFPNRGRDVLPFVHLVNSGALFKYELVCKLHTKRSSHRRDGDVWRQTMLSSLLSDPVSVQRILDRFEADHDIGLIAPDGSMHGRDYLEPNRDHLLWLTDALGLRLDEANFEFAAGSMFWIRPFLLRSIAALRLSDEDFEPELGQLDGTLSHALERLVSLIVQQSGMRIVLAGDAAEPVLRTISERPRPPVIAFYLPQFHPIPENDRWWGKGFTEWTQVARARPLFDGHDQPRLPADLGFYDLRLAETRAAQADLARAHGISAFCYHFYWFAGRRLLERPLEAVLASGEPDFPFCVCWANENWTRSWDGLSSDVLVRQSYEPEGLARLAEDLARLFRDRRYFRLDGRPLLILYRPADIPDLAGTLERWRARWRSLGLGEVCIAGVQFHTGSLPPRPSEAGLDAYLEFPPHGLARFVQPVRVAGLDPQFRGLIYRYADVVDGHVATLRESVSRETYTTDATWRGVMLGWDNTARRGLEAHICHGANPAIFRRWLAEIIACERASGRAPHAPVFINAWNEWAEGTYLEPDRRFGAGYLEAVRSALGVRG